jgi:glycosyltransferase involved in cell wall biosynthesis
VQGKRQRAAYDRHPATISVELNVQSPAEANAFVNDHREDPGLCPAVLFVHNRYQLRSGEDAVFDAEAALLRRFGHRVETFVVDSADLVDAPGPVGQLRLAGNAIWSRSSAAAVRGAIRAFRPDVVHIHNTFPLLSPAIYRACAAEGVPIVQTLHNYRLTCPAATLFRDGRACEDCVGRLIPLPGVIHACYKGSRTQSAVVAAMISVHHVAGSWKQVDRYVALSDFGRDLLVRAGFPASQIVVKPNFVDPDPGGRVAHDGRFVYAGRLSIEKGIRVLLRAWRRLPPTTPLDIMGDGPLAAEVAAEAAVNENITFHGQISRAQVLDSLRSATALIVPSLWYEGAPLNVIEAFGCGVPVIGSSIGAVAELVTNGDNGALFAPGNDEALAELVTDLSHAPERHSAMADAARRTYLQEHTAEIGYRRLSELYSQVVRERRPSAG